jgi:hypothetical protein
MKITDHTAKDTKETDTKNLSKNGIFQERKETQGILKQTDR